jgi:hypothetical protein
VDRSTLSSRNGEHTIVASCLRLATFLILPMLTIRGTANHEEALKIQEKSLPEGGVGRSRQPGRRTSARVPYDVFGSSSPAARKLSRFGDVGTRESYSRRGFDVGRNRRISNR